MLGWGWGVSCWGGVVWVHVGWGLGHVRVGWGVSYRGGVGWVM